MKNLVLLFICSVFLVTGCERKPTFGDHFNDADQINLKLIVDEFDRQIKEHYGSNNLRKAYANFFNAFSGIQTSEDFDEVNVIRKTKDDLFATVGEGTMHKIWNYSTSSDGKVVIQGINLDGPYLSFLEDKATDYPLLDEYLKSILQAGTIGPTNYVLFSNHQHKFDIKDIRIRLILAVHYINFTNETIMRSSID